MENMDFGVKALDDPGDHGVESYEVWDTVVESYNTSEGI
jgi:hypothetical protein